MMPSRSCAADRRVKGFTLFELIIVLAIMGMLAGVVAVGVGRSSGIRHQRDAITNIASQLQLARVEAMKRGEQIEATITLNESGIGCGFAGREHEFPCAGLEIAAVDGQEPEVLQSATRIDHFAERSVAASGWVLELDTEKPNPINSNDKALRLDQLDDIEVYFYHYTANRN